MITRLTREGRTAGKFFIQAFVVVLLICTLGTVSLSAREAVTRWWKRPRPVPPMMGASSNQSSMTQIQSPNSSQNNFTSENNAPGFQQGHTIQTRTVWVWPRPSFSTHRVDHDRDNERTQREEREAM